MRRAIIAGSLAITGALLSGCNAELQPTLPPIAMQFQYPLPPLLHIASDLFLPSIDLCAIASDEAIAETLATLPLGNLLADWITLEEFQLVEAVMEGVAPSGSTFQGFTEVSILESGRVLLTATPGNGIDGNRVTLRPVESVNLTEALRECPEQPSELTVRVRGFMPLNAPTRWETQLTLRLAVRISPF